MRNKTFFLSIIVILFISGCSKQQSYDFVINNVGLFDGYQNWGVVNIGINADSIAIISEQNLNSDSTLNASGKYLIPGLVNSHIHAWKEAQLEEAYQAGILAVMNMHSGDVERDQQMRTFGQQDGHAFYYSSGIGATVPGGHPTQISQSSFETINDTVPVQQWLINRLKENPDYIKIFRDSRKFPTRLPTLPFDSIQKLISYAKEYDKIVVVHASNMNEIRTISAFKPNGFVHGIVERDSIFSENDVAVLKENNTFIVPTNILIMKPWEFIKPGMSGYEQLSAFAQTPENIHKNIQVLHDGGITIVAGTDAGARPYINHGDDLLYELDIYSKAGLSNLEVLRTATGNASNVWDIPIGKLGVGSKLNMLLLNGNPLKDLGHLKDIEHIWKTK